MLKVAAAQDLVLQRARPLSAVAVQLSDALGLVLAEDAASDLDMPPFDKAMMDGYAVRVPDLPNGVGTLKIGEEITAGTTPKRPLDAGEAARIMTGAPIPDGTDAVVQVERTTLADALHVHIDDAGLHSNQNILQRGREMRAGEIVLRRGAMLRPQEIGVLATIGRASVMAIPRPSVAVLATGDELVEIDKTPGPGQIRNSNAAMLVAQVRRAGGVPSCLPIARDRVDSLKSLVSQGLQSDILILSGGVSAGKLDLVPGVLQELGVEPHFHKVEMKPGKPAFFGTRDEKLVFGLPGNPVSSFVCFELFVRPAIRRLRGLRDAGTDLIELALAEDFAYRTDRPTYHPARLETSPQGCRARIVPWFGSPDLRGLLGCNCLVLLPVGDHRHQSGQLLPVLQMENCD